MNGSNCLVLMALHLLWGVVLWFSISKYGLGVSTDAVHLLFGGQNLAAGNGLTSYDGMFIAFWPPLYPALLALVHLITGVDMLMAAAIVHRAGVSRTGIGALACCSCGCFPGGSSRRPQLYCSHRLVRWWSPPRAP